MKNNLISGIRTAFGAFRETRRVRRDAAALRRAIRQLRKV